MTNNFTSRCMCVYIHICIQATESKPYVHKKLVHECSQQHYFYFFILKGFSILLIFLKLINLFLAVLGLRFCARAFSSCGKRGPLFIAVRGPLSIAASLVAEHRLQRRRLSSFGSRAQLHRGMWDLPRPGLEPVSPALAGRFSTTAPPGKPSSIIHNSHKVEIT